MRLKISCIVCALLSAFTAIPLRAGELDSGSLRPAIPAALEDDFQTDDDEADSPLEPAMEGSGRRVLRYGAVLEFWLAEGGDAVTRMPDDISLTGMVDDLRQPLTGATMLRDAELKRYAGRNGFLRWTAYFRVTRPGKHVFALAASGLPEDRPEASGAALGINGDLKLRTPGNRDGSVVVDFPTPGWYQLHIWLWDTLSRQPAFQDCAVSLKIREPGSLSLRPLGKKDLYYKLP